MKKLLLTLVLLILAFSIFSLDFSAQVNVGYGYVAGKRFITRDNNTIDNQVHLKAHGIEVGAKIASAFSDNLAAEIYFDYLFARKGSFDPIDAPLPKTIHDFVKFTDYKAGFGIQYRKNFKRNNSASLSGGLNFTGISNHYFEDKEKTLQYAGNKVTSFGFYIAAFYLKKINKNLSLSIGNHICLNPFGIIRNFDPDQRKWFNYFPTDGKTNVKCFSTFAQLGVLFEI